MTEYIYTSEGITPQQIQDFFEGWPHPLSPETHLRLLANSDEVVLAVDDETGRSWLHSERTSWTGSACGLGGPT
jgi:hypothetical protein